MEQTDGEFLHREPAAHKCRPPMATQGSIWRCSCGQTWRAFQGDGQHHVAWERRAVTATRAKTFWRRHRQAAGGAEADEMMG